MKNKVHIIGGGLAGMAAAAALRADGFADDITIYEASFHLGGRGGSNFIPSFTRYVDDNHMMIRANKNVLKFLDIIGAKDRICAAGFKLSFKEKSFCKLWELAIESVLNTSAKTAANGLFFRTLLKALKAPFPLMVKESFDDTFILPFLGFAKLHRISVKYGMKCDGFIDDEELSFCGKKVNLKAGDKVIFALPYFAMKRLFPDLPVLSYNTISNIHFLLSNPQKTPVFCGVVGGVGHWYKVRGDVMSVTISNCKKVDAEIAQKVWNEAKGVLSIKGSYLKTAVINQKRATILQTPENLAARDKALQMLEANGIIHAGDWTVKSLPCTLEATALSGFKAAGKVCL